MKRAVSVSLGSSRRDKKVTLTLLGEEVTIERVGTDGDVERAIALYRELDGQVAALGVGGIDLGMSFVGRSYVHLREGDFCGGDLMLLRPTLTVQQREMLRNLVGSRKSALAQARTVGLGLLLKLFLRRLSLADAERRVAQALGVRGRVVPFPYAEIGMDVDKPLQLEIVRADLGL
jgi:hypothetical protein